MDDSETRDTEVQIREILDYYGGREDRASQETVVEMLRELQDAQGFLSPGILAAAAETAGVKESTVRAILKRCPSLKTAPYRHEIVVCLGKNCGGRNIEVLQELRRRLKTGPDGISADGRVKVSTRSCLKSCRTAPNVMVDGKICSGVSAEGILGRVEG
ncbi:NAD(P)H-dependent oxidoreductase subunit E [Enterocloster asparagiformis]|mgnify:CR=1 FL=1|uniref:NADH-quinone oxidoreductase subunit NuoE family protein n=1 Tax=Enterocloster asparagiformis TaxID=333367 RepID=UPI000465C0FA|nr:NAD(P)H-dependent oxidoreductase subunit E [Enterocloster asparagiformis]